MLMVENKHPVKQTLAQWLLGQVLWNVGIANFRHASSLPSQLSFLCNHVRMRLQFSVLCRKPLTSQLWS